MKILFSLRDDLVEVDLPLDEKTGRATCPCGAKFGRHVAETRVKRHFNRDHDEHVAMALMMGSIRKVVASANIKRWSISEH